MELENLLFIIQIFIKINKRTTIYKCVYQIRERITASIGVSFKRNLMSLIPINNN